MRELFKLRAPLSKTASWVLAFAGLAFVIGIWIILTMGENPIVEKGILPSPGKVLFSVGDLYRDNELIKNTALSLGRNLAGYVEAIVIAIPLGFIIGLFPIFRGSFQRQVDAIRYLPLTAVTGVFILWFGTGTNMKVHFLAFGIIIYLLPVVVQRIDEVKEVYLKTVYTIGANDWQTIKTVYFPSVMSRLSDDLRVLTAISWTYIIVAELIAAKGGIGALIWLAGQRLGRYDKVFALLAIIMLIGVVQDKIFIYLDKRFFPHKYKGSHSRKSGMASEESFLDVAVDFAIDAMKWVAMGVYFLLFINELSPFLGIGRVLTYLFGDTVWVIHLIMWLIIFFSVYSLVNKLTHKKPAEAVAS